MKLDSFKKQIKTKKRKGRGISAGSGKTAGRGTKGQNSRSGGGVRFGFEGGQMPLTQRVPKKRGFKSIGTKPQTVTLEMLNKLKEGTVVTFDLLRKEKIIKNASAKIVDKGDLKKKLTVKIPASKSAVEKIIKAGGKKE